MAFKIPASSYILGFIFLFHVQCICACSQGHYFHKFNKIGTICLSVYPNYIYSITWDLGTKEQMILAHISYGTWNLNDRKIILKDCEHNFQTICTYTNTEITIEESFDWLKGLKFTKDANLNDDEIPNLNEFPFDSKFDKSLAQKKREEHFNDKKKNTLYFGEHNDGGYQLWIHPNHSYLLKFKPLGLSEELTYSEGSWERKGNVLTLFDISLKCPFYLIITKEGLIPNQMMYSIHQFSYIFRYSKPPR